jgi:hypothetical protein
MGDNAMKFTKMDAVINLVGGGISAVNGNITYMDGQKPPSDAEIDAELKRLQDEYAAQEYARQREAEYPSIQECVHAILDDDLDALQKKRAAVKTKYPKS